MARKRNNDGRRGCFIGRRQKAAEVVETKNGSG